MNNFTIGTVYLTVNNLDKMLAFYENIIGLQVHERNGKVAHLGAGEHDLLVLSESADKIHSRGVTGLYHFAILVPARVQLAKSLKRLAETQTQLQGLSDHLVSEAIYLADPEGNGIEIYRDRARDGWYKNGQLQMGTVAMDVDGVMSTLTDDNATWEGLPEGTIMGHIHLHVADVPEAEAFYQTILGMDVLVNMGSASFMSYDGYHHHLGANIWGGHNPRTGEEYGLEKYDLHIHDSKRLDSILASIESQGIAITEDSGHYTVHDPANNLIVLRPTQA